jgi:hypothetical protein
VFRHLRKRKAFLAKKRDEKELREGTSKEAESRGVLIRCKQHLPDINGGIGMCMHLARTTIAIILLSLNRGVNHSCSFSSPHGGHWWDG